MNLQSSQRVAYEPLRSLDYVDISADYAAVGTPFANPVRSLLVDNGTDANMIVSFDGTTDHMFVAANSGRVLDYCSNRNSMGGNLEQSAGVQVYVRQESASPSSGIFYATVIYASQN